MEKNRKKVVVIRSDSGTYNTRLLNELRIFVEANFDVILLCWDRENLHPKKEIKEGYTIHRCKIQAPYASKLLFFLMPFWLILALNKQ